LRSVMPRRLFATAGLAALVALFALSGCQAAGKNPDDIKIPVIQPTAPASLCLNNRYPQEAPLFGEIPSSQLQLQETGIKILDLKIGEGNSPTIEDLITVKYTGWLEDGCIFDSSHVRGGDTQLLLVNLIQGWTQAMLTMAPGGIRRVEIPPDLGYRELGSPPFIPPNATLTFEIELVDVLTPDAARATATAIAADYTPTPTKAEMPGGSVSLPELSNCNNSDYPDSAPQFSDVSDDQLVLQASGISVFDLKIGQGKSPGENDLVNLHYTGWLINGCVFDSSYSRSTLATFPVAGVIPGFREAILGMSAGGQRRVKIPASLGYGDAGAGKLIPPGATLVFDIALESFKPR